MSLNPNDDTIAKFKRSYQGYLDNLDPESRQAFEELIDLCYPYLASIIAKGEPFEDDPVELTMMLVQQLIIKSLKEEYSEAEKMMKALHKVVSRIDSIEGELQTIRNIIDDAISKKNAPKPAPEFQSKLAVK